MSKLKYESPIIKQINTGLANKFGESIKTKMILHDGKNILYVYACVIYGYFSFIWPQIQYIMSPVNIQILLIFDTEH